MWAWALTLSWLSPDSYIKGSEIAADATEKALTYIYQYLLEVKEDNKGWYVSLWKITRNLSPGS